MEIVAEPKFGDPRKIRETNLGEGLTDKERIKCFTDYLSEEKNPLNLPVEILEIAVYNRKVARILIELAFHEETLVHSLNVGKIDWYVKEGLKQEGLLHDESDENAEKSFLVAALVHDGGKVGTEGHVLRKKGRLEEEEFIHITDHVENTAEILRDREFPANVVALAPYHHPKYGTDKTNKVEGIAKIKKQNPFAAALTLIDIFESMTSGVRGEGRGYQKGKILSPEIIKVEFNKAVLFDVEEQSEESRRIILFVKNLLLRSYHYDKNDPKRSTVDF